jgi:hypothetical protein
MNSRIFTMGLFLVLDLFSIVEVWARIHETFITPYLLIFLCAVLSAGVRAFRDRGKPYFPDVAFYVIGMFALAFAGNMMLIAVMR